MGHRLSKIYTRTGDDGSTGLGDGTRVSKDGIRVETFGTVDELNSYLGMLLVLTLPNDISELLTGIQHDLFDLGGEICIPGREALSSNYTEYLEIQLDKYNDKLAPLDEFILPGGCQAAALCHVARTICRRAERRLITLSHQESVSVHTVSYLNRLSDLLFVLARYLNHQQNQPDVLWQPGRHQTR